MKTKRQNKALDCLAILVLLVVGFVASPAKAQEESRIIHMVIGEQQQMTYPGMTKITLSNPNVVDARLLGGNAFLLFATGAGRASVLVLRGKAPSIKLTVVVSKVSVETLMRSVRNVLGDREGITIRPVGDKVILDGLAFTTEDYKRVKQVTDLYPQVTSFVEINPNAKRLMVDQLNEAFKQSGLRDVEATVVENKIFLEGSVETEEDLKKAENISKSIGEEVESLLTVGIERMVLIEVDYVEMKKHGEDHIGIKWPLNITAKAPHIDINGRMNLQPKGPHTADMSWGIEGFGSEFSFGFLFQDGYKRVLAQPKLVCASGETAEFLGGGEVPIVLMTDDNISVEWKEYGVKLKITPIADRKGNIQMQIETEVSEIDDSTAVNLGSTGSIPGFTTTRAATNVTVRHGQTIVLSGLFHYTQGKDVSKVPLLGHIPIIGELFKSRDFQEDKTELSAFVTPHIVNPDTPKIVKMISNIKDHYERAKSEVGFGVFD